MDSLTEYERDQTLLRAGLHEAEVAFIEPGTRRTLARRLAEVERERDTALTRAHRIEAAAAATAETLDALIYWHDCGDIDRSWWEDAREKLATLRAAMGETNG